MGLLHSKDSDEFVEDDVNAGENVRVIFNERKLLTYVCA